MYFVRSKHIAYSLHQRVIIKYKSRGRVFLLQDHNS